MGKHIILKLTERDLHFILEGVATLESMAGAMDENFTNECIEIGRCIDRALKRSGYKRNVYINDETQI